MQSIITEAINFIGQICDRHVFNFDFVSSVATVDPFKKRDVALLHSFPYCESKFLLKFYINRPP